MLSRGSRGMLFKNIRSSKIVSDVILEVYL